jgi:hypothetical protein
MKERQHADKKEPETYRKMIQNLVWATGYNVDPLSPRGRGLGRGGVWEEVRPPPAPPIKGGEPKGPFPAIAIAGAE